VPSPPPLCYGVGTSASSSVSATVTSSHRTDSRVYWGTHPAFRPLSLPRDRTCATWRRCPA